MADWRQVDVITKELDEARVLIEFLTAEVERLKDALVLERNRADFCAAEVTNLERGFLPALELLRLEIERLKAGRFTPAELQDLCHHLPESDACAFKAGCEAYQVKLFGFGAVAEEREACAEVAEGWGITHGGHLTGDAARKIANEIRARGKGA